MRQRVKVLGKTQIPYFVRGGSPTLLLHSGTHGDEYGVIESVKKAVEKYEERLPDFIYVPVVSPSAVAKRTRQNGDGVDLNRSFFDDTNIGEVEANLAIVRDLSFELLVTFHEDTDLESGFYVYDYGNRLNERREWTEFKEKMNEMGVGLHCGKDDPYDPDLNYLFTDGYTTYDLPNRGAFDTWAVENGVAKKAATPEIPGRLSQILKDRIVDLFFQKFLVGLNHVGR